MRADRLLSILILLQTQGQLTAQELAAELEVSERTIYRDMDALSTAGVPVYAERGPGGGCSLLDSYRTNLTGLTRDEVRALFMLSIPAPLAELGVERDLKAALLKLSAALPDVFRPEGARAQKRIHLDSSVWFQKEEHTPHIHTIQRALWEDRKLRLTYSLAFDAQVEHLVDPYGLVAKANIWHLVCSRDGFITVIRLPDVLDAQLSESKFSMPADFNLVEFWTAWCSKYESNRPQFPVQVRIKAELLKMLKFFRDPILSGDRDGTEIDADGWQTMTIHFETFEEARKQLLNFGGAVEIIKPQSLRRSVQDFAEQIVQVYNRFD
jgi:predicted DNA-binding transcriptional regulator YafY